MLGAVGDFPDQSALLTEFAVRQLVERYAYAVDHGDAELFAAQFTEDGVLEAPRGRFTGQHQLATVPPMMRSLYARTHHAVVGLVVFAEGTDLRAETACYARHYRATDGGESCYEMTIRYRDRLVMTAKGPKLAHRRLELIGESRWLSQPRDPPAALGPITTNPKAEM